MPVDRQNIKLVKSCALETSKETLKKQKKGRSRFSDSNSNDKDYGQISRLGKILFFGGDGYKKITYLGCN